MHGVVIKKKKKMNGVGHSLLRIKRELHTVQLLQIVDSGYSEDGRGRGKWRGN